jgi:hypothetical protein
MKLFIFGWLLVEIPHFMILEKSWFGKGKYIDG